MMNLATMLLSRDYSIFKLLWIAPYGLKLVVLQLWLTILSGNTVSEIKASNIQKRVTLMRQHGFSCSISYRSNSILVNLS